MGDAGHTPGRRVVGGDTAGPGGDRADSEPFAGSNGRSHYRAQLDSYTSRLPIAAAIAVLVTLVALFVMTGSLLVPIMAVIMSAASIAAAIGVVVFAFTSGPVAGLLGASRQAEIDSTMPILLGALASGLSTDYCVFLVARIKENHDRCMPSRRAVSEGLARSGPVLTAAALLFAVAIGALVLSEEVPLKQLGLGTAVAVLVDATVVRAVLLPALMTLLGECNWWAPAPLRALHRRLRFDRLGHSLGPDRSGPLPDIAKPPRPEPLVSRAWHEARTR
jgi:uncharacterized membrane protein YdfJ with MMPL/SSD domain